MGDGDGVIVIVMTITLIVVISLVVAWTRNVHISSDYGSKRNSGRSHSGTLRLQTCDWWNVTETKAT